MPKRYWGIILTYVLCQLSGIIPSLTKILDPIPKETQDAIWILISFSITLVIVLLLLLPERNQRQVPGRATNGEAILWGILGIFLAFVTQIIASNIDVRILGGSPESQNTNSIVKLAESAPYVILVVAIIGPILEEIIFRKIIFGSLYKKMNFWLAGFLSSFLFAILHMDRHLIVYTAIGYLFAYLYVKTKRIIVPIIAHASMNAIVVIIQIIYSDKMQAMIQHYEHTKFIKGIFLK